MSENTDDDYYCQYQELQSLLSQAYIDLYSVRAIEKVLTDITNNNKTLFTCSFNVLGHIRELLLSDSCLVIWKMYVDHDGKACTIKTLSTFINKNYPDIVSKVNRPKTSLKGDLKTISEKVNAIRNCLLAHNDSQKQQVDIPVSELEMIRDCLREMLNGLCLTEIDSRVTPLTEKELQTMSFNVNVGLGAIICQSAVPLDILN